MKRLQKEDPNIAEDLEPVESFLDRDGMKKMGEEEADALVQMNHHHDVSQSMNGFEFQ